MRERERAFWYVHYWPPLLSCLSCFLQTLSRVVFEFVMAPWYGDFRFRAIDSEGSGLTDVVENSFLSEVEALRVLIHQMSNLDPEPETQELLVRKHKAELDCIVAKRQKTQG